MDDNDNVTVAVLKVEVGYLSERIDEKVGGLDTKIDRLTDKVEDGLERSAEVEICLAVLKNQVDDNSKRTQKWDIANSALGLLLASALAYFGLLN